MNSENEKSTRSPDQWLEYVKQEERTEKKGRLKIFLGMCAGVGKTYSMLENAQELKRRGINVIVGYVETHGRVETEALLKNLQVIPRLKITYKERVFEDFDIDTILSMKPQVVIVDELAHSNIPGMRHTKRYLDILELLENGISVLTTLNAQHLESQKDLIKQITKITIHETVPDSIIDQADDIEIVDLSPQDLLVRLSEGKVYIQENAKVAAENFFSISNLTALREIALRIAAERVDNQLTGSMHLRGTDSMWKIGERLMVAVGPSPYSEKLIRWTRRIASSMNAPWLAVNVQKTGTQVKEENALLTKNINLALELGAELVTVTDDDIARALIKVAKLRNVSQIVVGKSLNHPIFDFFNGGSLINRLIGMSGDINIYIAQGYKSPEPKSKKFLPFHFSAPSHYGIASGIMVIIATLCFVSGNLIDYRSVGMFLLFAVLVLAGIVSRGPVLLAATLGAFLWNFFFIPPRFTYTIASLADSLMLLMYFLIALIGGSLTSRIRKHELTIQQREQDTAYLNSYLTKLTNAYDIAFLVRITCVELKARFGASSAIFLTDEEGNLSPAIHKESTQQWMDEKEFAVALWAFNNKKNAGHGTNTLSLSEYSFYPLFGTRGTLGVAGLKFVSKKSLPLKEQSILLTILQQFSLSIERENYRLNAEKTNFLSKSEYLYKSLLGSISHQLRTPIVIIKGAATELLSKDIVSDEQKRTILTADIAQATDRLDRLVKNLLDMTRIESGMLKLRLDWCDIREIIDEVVDEMQPLIGNHQISLEIQPELPLIRADEVLIRQAFLNIFHNALLYTTPTATVWIKANKVGNKIILKIEDNGPGIAQDYLPHIFKKFYRPADASGEGIGIGLSIARGFIEANKGSIHVENRIEGGARFKIIFPIMNGKTELS
jgi:two-component system sensor histidine kinase KdpD